MTSDNPNPFVSESGSFNYRDENNISMLAIYSIIPNTSNWKLIISINNTNAFSELVSVIPIDVLLISLVALILFAFIYANSISEPILRLRHVLEKS